MDPVNASAIEPVLADLRRTDAPLPVVVEEGWGEAVPAIVLRDEAGNSSGFALDPDSTPLERIVEAADRVQDWVIDQRYARGSSTNWPVCPLHPETHPLTATMAGGTAAWRCPETEDGAVAIGALPPRLQIIRHRPGRMPPPLVRPPVDDPLDPLLAVALQPVLRDLRVTRGPAPRILHLQWADLECQRTATFVSDTGTAGGISVRVESDPADRVVEAADSVQEWAVEALWNDRLPNNWPPCPAHPTTHPLRPELRAGAPSWCCPATGSAVAAIGALPPAAASGRTR